MFKRKVFFMVFSCICCWLLAVNIQAGDNIVKNPNFTTENGRISFWKVHQKSMASFIDEETKEACGKTAYTSLNYNETMSRSVVSQNMNNVKPGNYVLGLSAKAIKSKGMYIAVVFRNKADKTIDKFESFVFPKSIPLNKWQRLEFKMKAPATTVSIRLVIETFGELDKTGSVLINKISLCHQEK